MLIYERLVRPVIFALSRGDPERAHEAALKVARWFDRKARRCRLLSRIAGVRPTPSLQKQLFGVTFPNPVGLAAGFDKNIAAPRVWEALGFGFVEGGTVTHLPQDGNPRPRIFRHARERAIRNQMGFSNRGATAVANDLLANTAGLTIPLGISIGKSKAATDEGTKEDYVNSLLAESALGLPLFGGYASYVAVNVSSPNTPGLRNFEKRDKLFDLCRSLRLASRWLTRCPPRLPILVKFSPDQCDADLDASLDACEHAEVDGIIATNTTTWLVLPGAEPGKGGVSGAPLHDLALHRVAHIRKRLPNMPLIGVGGIEDADGARRMFDAGADLVQLYTGLIYYGPFLAAQIVHQLEVGGLKSLAPKAPEELTITDSV